MHPSIGILIGHPLAIRRIIDSRIRNRHNLKPIDLLPPYHPSNDPDSDDEKVRSALRQAEAESMVAASGDIAGE